MAKRGRPPKKKSAAKKAQQQTITSAWGTKKQTKHDAGRKERVAIKRQIAPTEPPSRQFETEDVVFVEIPKFELTSQVPLYAQRGNQPSQSSVEGKIPLEDWSNKELALFKEELIALQARMRNTRFTLENENKHLQQQRDRASFPIPAIAESEYRKEPSNKHRRSASKNDQGSLGKLQQSLLDRDNRTKDTKVKIPRGLLPISVPSTVQKNSNPAVPITIRTKPTKPVDDPMVIEIKRKQGEDIPKPIPIITDLSRGSKSSSMVKKQPRDTSNPLTFSVDSMTDVTMDESMSDSESSTKPKRRGNRKKRDLSKTGSEDKRRRKKRRVDVESSDEDELINKPASSTPLVSSADFWGTMEPFIAPFNPVDLKCLEPYEIPSDDIAIPPLGKHYSITMQDSKPAKEEEKEKQNEISCGDLTQRLFASMLEQETYRDLDTTGISRSCLPLDVPPTADYNSNKMETLEDRISMELRCIGLLDEETTMSSREDDEICTEIRLLQRQLKDRIATNNEKRQKFYEMARKKQKEIQPELKQGAENRSVEFIYDRKRTKKKGRKRTKGRPRGRPPSTPATPATPTPTTPLPTGKPSSIPFGSPPTKKPRSIYQIPSKAPVSAASPQPMQLGESTD